MTNPVLYYQAVDSKNMVASYMFDPDTGTFTADYSPLGTVELGKVSPNKTRDDGTVSQWVTRLQGDIQEARARGEKKIEADLGFIGIPEETSCCMQSDISVRDNNGDGFIRWNGEDSIWVDVYGLINDVETAHHYQWNPILGRFEEPLAIQNIPDYSAPQDVLKPRY